MFCLPRFFSGSSSPAFSLAIFPLRLSLTGCSITSSPAPLFATAVFADGLGAAAGDLEAVVALAGFGDIAVGLIINDSHEAFCFVTGGFMNLPERSVCNGAAATGVGGSRGGCGGVVVTWPVCWKGEWGEP